jgi:hypothetical protein
VVSFTAAATLRQFVTFVANKVVEEDRRTLLTSELESMTLPDGTTQALRSRLARRLRYLRGLCLLGNGQQFLQLKYLHKTFALELLESVFTNDHELDLGG